MSRVVPPPGSDHSIWELEKATLETPSKDPVRAGVPKCCLEEHDLPSDKPIRFAIRLFRQKACLLWLTLARLISLFFSVVRLVDEVVGGRFFLFPLPISLCRNLDSDEQEI